MSYAKIEAFVMILGIAAAQTSTNSPGFKFSLNSRRNITGHWIAQVNTECLKNRVFLQEVVLVKTSKEGLINTCPETNIC